VKINLVLAERIVTLSEFEGRLDRLKRLVSNWKMVALVSIGMMTAKVAAEQLVMAIR
jgi:hypothetical protein